MFTKTEIEKYFTGEKQESLVFLGIGIAAIAAAIIFLLIIKTSFYNGMAWPLIIIGLVMTVVGYTIFKRSDDDRKRNVYAYDMNPGQLKEKEIPRMEVVMKSFVTYRYVEIILAATGLFLCFYFNHKPAYSFWQGLGLGLSIMALLGLGADYFAEQRGRIYLDGLKSFVQ